MKPSTTQTQLYKPLYTNFVLLIFFICQTVSIAQQLPIHYLNISQGLSNNSVTAFYKDKNGFMWLGSYDGLNRYDGNEFKVFRHNLGDPKSLANSYIYCLEGDSKNNIWVGSANGASIYDPLLGNFSQLYYKDASVEKKLYGKINKISAIGKDFILLASQKSGLITYINGSNTGKIIPLRIKRTINYEYEVTDFKQSKNQDLIWVSVYKHGLYLFNLKTLQLTLKFPLLKEIRSIELLDENTLLLGANDGLFSLKLNRPGELVNMFREHVIVNDLFKDKLGNIYVATDGSGVYIISRADKLMKHYTPPTDNTLLRSRSVWTVYEDEQRNLWIGTLRGGVSVVEHRPAYFRHITGKTDPLDLSEDFILSFCEDRNKKIWIGTDGTGIRCWDGKNYSLYNSDNSALSSNFITGITQDADGTIWASAWAGGVNNINPKTKKITAYPCINSTSGQEEKNAWFVFRDLDNNIWSGNKTPGSLYRLNRAKKKFELFNPELKDLLCFTQAKDGKFWTGNYTKLYSITRNADHVESYSIGYAIRCILEDKDGNLWIGTSEGGLLLFNRKTKKHKRFTTNDGLPANTILQLLEDKNGNIWMSTYSGLCRFNIKTKLVRKFTVSDGLQSNQFSYNASLKLSTGEFLFGGINGFNIFVPEQIADTPRDTGIMITDITINNQPVEKNAELIKISKQKVVKSLTLPYEKTTLSVEFCVKDLLPSGNVQYAYYLEGWDHQWHLNGKNRQASYTRLREGTYTLKAKTTDIYGKWAVPVKLLTITVLPPWYRTWWMYSYYTLMALLIAHCYIRYRKRQESLRFAVKVAEIERSKERELAEKQLTMFTFMSHELRTPLSLIINPLKKVLREQIESTNKENKTLIVAYRNARRLLSLVDQLLLFRKAESDADELTISQVNLNELCTEIYNCFLQQAEEQNLNFKLYMPEHSVTVLADLEKLEIALFNLFSNAFKYTPAEESVTINLTFENNTAIIQITDTGCGIKTDELPFIYNKFKQINTKTVTGKGFGIGLFIVKHFIDMQGATINCESIHRKGTTFTITIAPASNQQAHQEIKPVKVSAFLEELMPEVSNTETKEEKNPLGAPLSEVYSEKKSILIVDDNNEMNEYLSQLFADNYIVYNAFNGTQGLMISQKVKPDIIVSDISMEEMDGLELCKIIKQNEDLAHIPVILLTASTDSEARLKGISEGADDYITKPFDADILLARIQALIKGRLHLRKYFLDSITLNGNIQKVPLEYKEFLERCIIVIEANLDNQNFSIKNFAKEMLMSHTSLAAKVKNISGQTLNVFIRSVKLRRAAVLMLTENITIAQAGIQVGFEDKKYFREQFSKTFGLTPSEYIKKYKDAFINELNTTKNKE